VDTDGDGSFDHLDTDSDNDGLSDTFEASGTVTADIAFVDANNDGMDDATAANALPTPDFDDDGVADHRDVDSDGDGLPDALESVLGAVDSDVDGQFDHLDLDADNDGLPDTLEGGSSAADDDNDGIDNRFDADATGGADLNTDGIDDAAAARDFDADGIPDFRDLDTDNDGLTDATEAGLEDTDNDGVVDGFADFNSDGLDDVLALVPATLLDTDSDFVFDFLDLDSDNDGLADLVEAGGTDADQNGRVDDQLDSNNNGLDDRLESMPLTQPDTDTDGVVNYRDVDSDNDGITDTTEAGGSDLNGDGVIDGFADINSDGVDDATAAAPLPITDSDNNGSPDYVSVDSDADGIPDAVEAGVMGWIRIAPPTAMTMACRIFLSLL